MDAGRVDLADPRRRGGPGRRHGHLPPAQGRDLPLPADPGADRPPAGRLAGHLVAGRRRRCRTRSTRSRSPRPSPRWPGGASAATVPQPVTRPPPRARSHGRRPSWPPLLATLLRGEDLTADDTAWAMGEIMAGEATPVQIAGFVVALRAKGETVDEIDGPGPAMLDARRTASRCRAGASTSSAPAATGPTPSTSRRWPRWSSPAPAHRVVKHGNRAASSALRRGRRAGGARASALDLTPDQVARGRRARSGSRSASPRCSTRRSGTPRWPGASSASPPPSTSSAR